MPLERALHEALLELREHGGGEVEARAVVQALLHPGGEVVRHRRLRTPDARERAALLVPPALGRAREPLGRPFIENERAARREQ